MTQAKGSGNGVYLVFACFFRAYGLPWRFSDIYSKALAKRRAKGGVKHE